jgi:hypothetical protein
MGKRVRTKEDADAMCRTLVEVCQHHGFIGVAAVVMGDHEGASVVGRRAM